MVSFETEVLVHGQTATYLEVPARAVAALGPAKRPPVTVTIGTFTYRSTVAPMRGQFMLPLNRANRDAAGVKAGDTISVEIELDTEPRVVEVPADLAAALAGTAAADAFGRMSYTHQKEYVDWINEARRPQTRERRVLRTLEMLASR